MGYKGSLMYSKYLYYVNVFILIPISENSKIKLKGVGILLFDLFYM